MKPVSLYWKEEHDSDGSTFARCDLCFRACRIAVGDSGLCRVRRYDERGFHSPYLGKFSACAVDPIEKKPLHHWRAGSLIFSLGSVGCNMHCPFCQNHSIAHPSRELELTAITEEELLLRVKDLGLSSVAYTYNEPTLQAEYILQTAPLLRENGISTVLVTNGLFSDILTCELIKWVDALNIDVKTFNSDTYQKIGGSLESVKANIERLASAGLHIELTNLVVPGISDSRDDFVAMVDWIAGLSKDIPLHISRYFPAHKYTQPPVSIERLTAFSAIASAKLSHVHLGNVR